MGSMQRNVITNKIGLNDNFHPKVLKHDENPYLKFMNDKKGKHFNSKNKKKGGKK